MVIKHNQVGSIFVDHIYDMYSLCSSNDLNLTLLTMHNSEVKGTLVICKPILNIILVLCHIMLNSQ